LLAIKVFVLVIPVRLVSPLHTYHFSVPTYYAAISSNVILFLREMEWKDIS